MLARARACPLPPLRACPPSRPTPPHSPALSSFSSLCSLIGWGLIKQGVKLMRGADGTYSQPATTATATAPAAAAGPAASAAADAPTA